MYTEIPLYPISSISNMACSPKSTFSYINIPFKPEFCLVLKGFLRGFTVHITKSTIVTNLIKKEVLLFEY